MFDVKSMLKRQALWQHSRAKLSWTEKLRMAEILREAALVMGSSQRKLELGTESKSGVSRNDAEPT